MTEPENNQDQAGDELQVDELSMLKQRATVLGIPFSNNIGLETLRERVRAKMEGEVNNVANGAVANPLNGTTGGKTRSLRKMLQEENLKLIRVKITCLDPKKKDLPGEIITVANEYIGTVKKYIPFGRKTANGYHIPYCIYKMLKKRQFQHVNIEKDERGKDRVEYQLLSEFSLEVLPPLTPEERSKLAQAQLAAGSIQ